MTDWFAKVPPRMAVSIAPAPYKPSRAWQSFIVGLVGGGILFAIGLAVICSMAIWRIILSPLMPPTGMP